MSDNSENPMALAASAVAMRNLIEVMHRTSKQMENSCRMADALSMLGDNAHMAQPKIIFTYGGQSYEITDEDGRIRELAAKLARELITKNHDELMSTASQISKP